VLLALRAALLHANRAPDALEAGQQAIDLLLKQPLPKLTTLGYVMALQAKTQADHGRLTRALQLLQDWETRLARRANEAFNHPEWGVQVLWIGLVVRSVRPDQYPAALLRDLADEAVSVTEQHAPETWVAWAARRDLATLRLAFKEYPEALETLRPLTLVEDRPSNLYIRLPVHAHMGRLLMTLNRPGEALPYFKESIDLEHEAVLRGRLMREMGQAHVAAGNAAAAAELYSEALSYLTREDAPDDHVTVLVDLAYARLSLQRFSDAIDTFEKALDIVQELPDKALMASVLTDLANAHATLGQHRRATVVYRRALGYQKQPEQIAQTYIALARSSAAIGSYPQALDAYQSALEYPHTPLMQRALISEQAAIYVNQKRPNEAIAYYQQALEIEGAAPTEVAAIRRNLGQLYAGVGQHEQARVHFQSALAAVEDEQSGLTLLAIAEGHRAQNQPGQALEAYATALEHLSRAEYPLERALVLRTMGEMYLIDGRAAEALESLEGALEIERTQTRQDGGRIVSILDHIAQAHEIRGELDKAAVRYHQALVYQDARHAPEGYAGTLRTLGRIYTTMRRFDDAAKALEEALGTEYTQPTQDAGAIDETSKMLADVYRAQGRLDEAAQLYRKVTPGASEPIRAGAEAALTNTLSEIARYEDTLKAARQSWQLLNRTGAELKELLFIIALEAQTYHALGRHDESADALERLMVLLQKRKKDVTPQSKDPAIRALAWMLEGQAAEDGQDLERAIQAYRDGLTLAEANRLPPALVWALRQKIGRSGAPSDRSK
jgi:tetratricopeptide (TPR) repeat protein